MLYSSKLTFLSGCLLLSQDRSGSPRFHILITTIERNKRGSFSSSPSESENLSRRLSFPECILVGVLGLNGVSVPSWTLAGGWYCYHSWTIKVHLEAQVALPDGLSLHSAWRLTVHTGLLDAHLPLLERLHHLQAASFHRDTLLTWLELWHCTRWPFHEASPEIREALNPQYGPTPCTNEFVTQLGFRHPCTPSPHWDWLLTQWQSVPTRVKTLLRCNFYSSLFKEASWYDK